MYLIYLLSKNPIKDSLRTNSKEQHHLLGLIKSNKNITDVLLIVPPQAKTNAKALESHIKEISDARTHLEDTEFSYLDGDVDSKVDYINTVFSNPKQGFIRNNKFKTAKKIIHVGMKKDNELAPWLLSAFTLELPIERFFNSEAIINNDGQTEFIHKEINTAAHLFGKQTTDSPQQLRRNKLAFEQLEQAKSPLNKIIGRSKTMETVRSEIKKLANEDVPILLLGESGVGKTYIAKIIHELSDRPVKMFQNAEISSTEEDNIATELFGSRSGSYTNVVDRKGWIENGDGGTVFIDELGKINITAQNKLHRVIDEKKFKPIGSADDIEVDVRFILATNSDLQEMIEQDKFQSDLYNRIKHYTIEIPPLRERTEDIPLLINHFLKKNDFQWKFSDGCVSTLKNVPLDGNVRDLENIIEKIHIYKETNEGDEYDYGDIAEYFENSYLKIKSKSNYKIPSGETLYSYQKDLKAHHILKTLLQIYRESGKIKLYSRTGDKLGTTADAIKGHMRDHLHCNNVDEFIAKYI